MKGIPPLVYSEFKGYHPNLYSVKIKSKEQSCTIVTGIENVFLRLYTPNWSEDTDQRLSPPFHEGDISFIQTISAMGIKERFMEYGAVRKKNQFLILIH